ncbi:hypothetical protein H5410_041151 [Solanum commersonii]|uniref:Uncharacterized protein n=1 Tax=Solanum commersonii TaxID=4109 RepID=A0A9J5XS72_SOLCO|nr:hypothetical protein H5410_041151 [Solanum commersonii]
MDPPWVTKGRGRGSNTRGRGRSSPGSSYSGLSYGSASNSPIIQRGRMSLINSKISQSEASSSSAYLSQKQSDTFASIAKEDNDDIKSYEKVSKKRNDISFRKL